jgi:hypothetical protein
MQGARQVSDLAELSMTEAADAFARGEVKAEALMRACLARIDAHNPKLNVTIRLDREAALDAASAADMALGHAISLEENRYWVTVRMVTDFVEAAAVGDWVEGTGVITGREDDLFTVTGRIWCGDRTVMSATGVFKALGARPPRRKA